MTWYLRDDAGETVATFAHREDCVRAGLARHDRRTLHVEVTWHLMHRDLHVIADRATAEVRG